MGSPQNSHTLRRKMDVETPKQQDVNNASPATAAQDLLESNLDSGADQLQAKIDQILGEIDVDKMLSEVQSSMQPIQDKIAEMSNSIFSRVDEMSRKISELELKVMQVLNETAAPPALQPTAAAGADTA